MKKIKIAFNFEPLYLSPEQILATKILPPHIHTLKKYKQIQASINEVGIIEPLSITAQKGKNQLFILLDGHLRFEILKDLGCTKIPCLISADDESYTHNKHINRLATIQEHFMIRRAIEQGVNEERLAKALHLDIQSIQLKLKLLNGICPEVIDLLKDREISPQIFSILRKMKPLRQIECTTLMLSLNNLTVLYAKALLIATNNNLLVTPLKKTSKQNPSIESIKKIENDVASLHLQYKNIEQNYAQDTLKLVLAIGYLTKLTLNVQIRNYLEKYHPEILASFESLIKLNSIEI